MESGAAEAAEDVDAVLQGVLDDTQQWAALQSRISSVHQRQMPLSLSEPQQADCTCDDQAPQALLAGSASSQLSVPRVATAPDPSPHMSPVTSAINPLFLPAQSSRPQSAQLQQTLSAMSDQLTALEESMQHLPEDGAAGTPAGTVSAQSAEVKAIAALSQQQGEPSYRNHDVGGSKTCMCWSAHATSNTQLDVLPHIAWQSTPPATTANICLLHTASVCLTAPLYIHSMHVVMQVKISLSVHQHQPLTAM